MKNKKTTVKKDFVSAHKYMQMYGAKYLTPESNVRMRSDDAVEEGKKWTEYNAS